MAAPDDRAIVTSVTGTDGAVGPEQAMARLTVQELFERLGWFVAIRWFAATAALLLVLVGWYGFDVRIPPRPVVLTICAVLIYNAFFLLLVTDAYRRRRIHLRFVNLCANGQIACDMLALALLMHFTGGVENHFIIFFVCPLVIASELLPNRIAYLHALLAAVLINLVAWLEYAGVLAHVAVGRAVGVETYQSPVFVAKFTAATSLLAFATVFLGGSIAARLRRREADLEAAHAQLRDLEESKSFLMRRTSHDLRAPLDALVSLLRTVAHQVRASGDITAATLVQRAEQRASGLSCMIDELHRYSSLRDAADQLPMQPVDVADLASQAVGLYQAAAGEQDITLSDSISGPAWVCGHAESLSELISNLLSNALQYTPAGGAVELQVARTPDLIELSVRDTGIGIPPKARAHIFEEFYRAENAKAAFRAGTGLGLPIVKRIADIHHAELHVESEEGAGSRFIVRLPRCAPAAVVPARSRPAPARPPGDGHAATARIAALPPS